MGAVLAHGAKKQAHKPAVPARAYDQEIVPSDGTEEHVGGRTLDDLALDLDTLGLGPQVGDRVLDHELGCAVQITQTAIRERVKRLAQIAIARCARIAESPGVNDSEAGLPQARLCHRPTKGGACARGAVDTDDDTSACPRFPAVVHDALLPLRVAQDERPMYPSSVARAAGLTGL
jgi:hypothetical protein